MTEPERVDTGKQAQLALQIDPQWPVDEGRASTDRGHSTPISLLVQNAGTPMNHLAPAVTTPVYDAFWFFAAERQRIFIRRVLGQPRPWTLDDTMGQHKFTNAYRASDRVSQYLIRRVIYRSDLPSDVAEVTFRILLFKIFNKIETWMRLESAFGAITLAEFSFAHYDSVLSRALAAGETIYSAAYIMPPGKRQFGHVAKHQNHLRLLERMMRDELPKQIAAAPTMRAAFESLVQYPTIGDFLAYQFTTDINYSDVMDFEENTFVTPGPGAKDGIRKCFSSLGGLSEIDAIRLVVDIQDAEFTRLGIAFPSLWGRKLKLIDCQNLFCEISKYARAAYPNIIGPSGRTRIKQKFRPARSLPPPWYPPKWGLNERIARALSDKSANSGRQYDEARDGD